MSDSSKFSTPGFGEAPQTGFEAAKAAPTSTSAQSRSALSQIYRNPLVRRIAIPLLKATARDITIKHHFTGSPFRLNTFQHKTYWYRGKDRERHTMELCQRIIRPGNTVVEVGGHIGYLSAYFASLVGLDGHVHIFEPGDNNLPYLRQNITPYPQCKLVEKAVGSEAGKATLFVENLTGQNNSLVADHSIFKENVAAAFDKSVQVTERTVDVVRLDDYAAELSAPIDVVKIDVEGFEYPVLKGMTRVLETGPILILEVQSDHAAIVDLLSDAGYSLFDDRRQQLSRAQVLSIKVANIICVPSARLTAFLG